MRTARAFLTLLVPLALASLACLNSGGIVEDIPLDKLEEALPTLAARATEAGTALDTADMQATVEAAAEVGGGVESGFPPPESPDSLSDLGGGVNVSTDLSLEEVLDFYRDEFSAQGLIENTDLTEISDNGLNLVFDGHESGRAVVVQAVRLPDGKVNVSIRLEDL